MYTMFYTSKTALSANQSKLDIISNNIANSDSTGYKKINMEYSDLVDEVLYCEQHKTGNLHCKDGRFGQPENRPYDAREDRKKRELPPISPLNIDLDNYRKIVLIFPVWGYTPALPMQSFLRKHSLNNEVEIISVGVGRLGGMYE